MLEPSQSKKFQRDVLESASREGYADLYWFCEAALPPSLRKTTGRSHFPAAYPGKSIPVIPVAPDAKTSQAEILLLCTIFQLYNPQLEFYPALTLKVELDRIQGHYYTYGESFDVEAICYACGGIGRVSYVLSAQPYLCSYCSQFYEGDHYETQYQAYFQMVASVQASV